MKGFLFRNPLIWAGLVVLVITSVQAEDNAQIPSEAFSALPKYQSPKLSPSGERVAFIQNYSGDDAVSVLTTYDFSQDKFFGLLKSDNEKVKINWFRWVNDERLVVSARYESRVRHVRFYETRLYSLNWNDKGSDAINLVDPRRLSATKRSAAHTPQFQDTVVHWLPDDPEHILMAIDVDTPLQPSVYKVNVYKGNMKRLLWGKRKVRDWLADRQGNVRIGISQDNETGETRVLLNDENDWHTLFEYNAMHDKPIFPLGFDLDPNVLYYKAYKGDYKTLYTLNLATGIHTEVYHDPEADIDGGLIYSTKTGEAIGIYHSGAEDGKHFWIDHHGPLLRGLNEALPDFHNALVSFSDDEQKYILGIESDSNPGGYLYGDRSKGSLEPLFNQYPDVDPADLAEHKLVRYSSRDGLEIEGYLTLPKTGQAPFPTIIHPHGGPGARDYSGFDYWTAFFSSRGYAVLRPNFRGSSGYGYEFSQAQMRGWGLQMQDDITDAAQWMIGQGYANPEKMCIVGASYGGYAAMMATVKTPELFSCAVSFAGVSDLERVVYRSRSFTNEEFVKNQIGDDDDDLEKRSPISHVAGIKTPILLLHGEEDRVVHVEQSREMAEELEDLKKPFKYVELESGDHYLSIQRNRHKVFAEMDAFLGLYLGHSHVDVAENKNARVE
ncbi:S9 family peptidase [Alteromonas aestuariivivens]|uniref:S9 family peptidase n=1 Tax=Alteromonas aestuariivivens TaxID=1938339 RepID=A0A3D8M583_9ALTE|nr:S9 family peptidase [Alteromonas aestuariivivens]RDV24826.1 S9 family peptidase [Alteromonas aestuariivivens]